MDRPASVLWLPTFQLSADQIAKLVAARVKHWAQYLARELPRLLMVSRKIAAPARCLRRKARLQSNDDAIDRPCRSRPCDPLGGQLPKSVRSAKSAQHRRQSPMRAVIFPTRSNTIAATLVSPIVSAAAASIAFLRCRAASDRPFRASFSNREPFADAGFR